MKGVIGLVAITGGAILGWLVITGKLPQTADTLTNQQNKGSGPCLDPSLPGGCQKSSNTNTPTTTFV